LLWLQVGDGGVVDRIESPELKIDDFVVEGVAPVGDGSPGEWIVSAKVGGDELVASEDIAVCWYLRLQLGLGAYGDRAGGWLMETEARSLNGEKDSH